MDSTCWKIIGIAGAIVTALATTVVVLWTTNGKLHEELLNAEEKSKQVLRELYERMLERLKK